MTENSRRRATLEKFVHEGVAEEYNIPHIPPEIPQRLRDVLDGYHPRPGDPLKVVIEETGDENTIFAKLELDSASWSGEQRHILESMEFIPAPDGRPVLVVRSGYNGMAVGWEVYSAQFEAYPTEDPNRKGNQIILQWKSEETKEYVFTCWKW